jgi:hypothetical protein
MPWAVSTEMRSTEETAGGSWPSTSNRMPLIWWASSPATLGADWTSSRPARQEYLGVRLGGPNPARFLAGLRRLPPAPPDTLARAAQTVLAVLAGPPEADVVALEALADSEQALLAGIASYVLAYAREALGDLDGALSATRRALALLSGAAVHGSGPPPIPASARCACALARPARVTQRCFT